VLFIEGKEFHKKDGFGGVAIFICKCIESIPIFIIHYIYNNAQLIVITANYFDLTIEI